MAFNAQELSNWMGRQLRGSGGEKIGKIDDIYIDDRSGEPEWLAVTTGLFGTRRSFVPIADARFEDEAVVVPYGKDMVKDAPNAEHDGHLSPEEEAQLYRHYGIEYATAGLETGMDTGPSAETEMPSAAERGTDDAMTRSEEELEIDTVSQPAGRARLRKWVETERVSERVPLSHEEVRVEREPITEANIDEAMSGPEISEAEHTEVLHEEQAVTNKQAVPKERVRLEKSTVTETEDVEEEVRKERIAVEGDTEGTT